MSIYNPNIPQPTDDLSDSQGQMLQNFSKANSSFGIDHYAFSDLTVNNGKHNQITTPAFIDNPPTGLPPVTAANEPKMYAFQDSANVGVLNYSRGPSNAVPSPLTFLQSPSAALVILNNGTTNILDFTGLSKAMCMLYTTDLAVTATNSVSYIVWTGTSVSISRLNVPAGILPQAAGPILQIRNTSGVTYNNFYWTLQMLRLA